MYFFIVTAFRLLLQRQISYSLITGSSLPNVNEAAVVEN
jgi:hypothetical protein